MTGFDSCPSNSATFVTLIQKPYMYSKSFEVRWSDLDANWHLANSAYTNFMSHTRMSYFYDNGFTPLAMKEAGIGPVVFYEHMYYFREVLPGPPIRVTLELKGLSKDGMFFEFLHNFYDFTGKHKAQCEMMGGWIDMKARKLCSLQGDLLEATMAVEKAEDFRWLTREDTRKFARRPKDLE